MCAEALRHIAPDAVCGGLTVALTRRNATVVLVIDRSGSMGDPTTDGRVKWETTVAPYTAPDVDPDLEKASESLSTRLYRISCEVSFTGSDGRERKMTLATTRVGARNPA